MNKLNDLYYRFVIWVQGDKLTDYGRYVKWRNNR